MKFILATKQHMLSYFDREGKAVPATLLRATPLEVSRIKEKEKDGYESIVVAYMVNKSKKSKEFRVIAGTTEQKPGDKIDASTFNPGDVVTVSGISKSKGFQGVVKRHGFGGGPRTHGQKHSEREPGSIGGGLRTRVPKGMRMAGRMGGDRITVKNLNVIAVDKDKSEILISGAIPGRRGTVVEIRG